MRYRQLYDLSGTEGRYKLDFVETIVEDFPSLPTPKVEVHTINGRRAYMIAAFDAFPHVLYFRRGERRKVLNNFVNEVNFVSSFRS